MTSLLRSPTSLCWFRDSGLLLLVLATLCCICQVVCAQIDAAQPGDSSLPDQFSSIDFDRDIRPLLSDNCYPCHGPDDQQRQAGLRLDTPKGAMADLGGYAALVPGDPEESEAIRRVFSDDPYEVMPPPDSKLRLTADEKELLAQWVAAGGEWSAHWSLVAPAWPTVPDDEQGWSRNPVDRFIRVRAIEQGLSPQSAASKPALLRRVTLDLTGLPPTLSEMNQFLEDDAPGAYERVVDRLLASPRYGERMAWEWLEAARYADTDGFQGDPTRTMWPWRDWLIAALNQNMPFDQFTLEMLAGDLLQNATPEQVLASGFNRNHMFNGEGGRIPEETRVENVFDRTETTSTVWLGLTMTCCRCHDHKYDPISQQEYFQFFDFFNQTSETGRSGRGKTAPVLDYLPPEQRKRRARLKAELSDLKELLTGSQPELDKRQADWERMLAGRLNAAQVEGSLAADSASEVPAEIIQCLMTAAEERSEEQRAQLQAYFRAAHWERWSGLVARQKALQQQLQELEKSAVTVMVMDQLPMDQQRQTRVLERGAYDQPTTGVKADTPDCLPALPKDAPRNRVTLARWLVSPDNPLTARVTVNRYWQTFFGKGLVATTEDFGSQGKRPTHPQLLDWLAKEFVRSGWDVKQMHKLLVMSATYRQTGAISEAAYALDPENKWLARAPRYRLPSWMLRDQALAASGLLVSAVGGPPVRPYQPQGLWAEATFGKIKYERDTGEDLYRRSLYTFWRRIVGPPMFFDVAKRQTCEVKPTRTNSPLHALTLLNDITFVEAARHMAQQVLREHRSASPRLTAAFRLVTGRRPESAELDVLFRRLDALLDEFATAPEEAEALLSVGEAPLLPAQSQAEVAAWTVICSLLLNLDEALTKP